VDVFVPHRSSHAPRKLYAPQSIPALDGHLSGDGLRTQRPQAAPRAIYRALGSGTSPPRDGGEGRTAARSEQKPGDQRRAGGQASERGASLSAPSVGGGQYR